MKTYGIGIIGAGFMGRTHTYNYVNLPLFYDDLPFKVKLIGICNRTLSKAERLKEDFGFEFATSSYTDLLDRKDIDIIDVCTPNYLHHEQITASLRAGKHVYADKPLCITDEEADDIVRVAEKAGVIHQIAFHYRFYPWSFRIKKLIDDEFFSKIISFRVTYYHSSNIKTKKFRGWKQDVKLAGGGTLVDMGSHVLDLLYNYLGEFDRLSLSSMILHPERPDDSGRLVRIESEDHVLINARMKNGAFGTMEISKIIAGSNDDLNIEIYGTEGALRFQSMDPNHVYIYDMRDEEEPLGGMRGYKALETINKDPESKGNFPGPRFPIGWLRGHLASQYYFLKYVHENRPAVPSLRDGAYIQRVMNRLYSVNNKKRWVSV